MMVLNIFIVTILHKIHLATKIEVLSQNTAYKTL